MDSFELNKIAGAGLAALLLVVAVNQLTGLIFNVHAPEKPGYEIAVASSSGGKSETPAQASIEPIAVRLAKADVAKGQTEFKKCATCHTPDKGGPNRVGPNLWNVVEGPKAHMPDFSYSAGVKERGAKGESWTYEDMDKFIASPKGFISGTAMAFAGISDPQARANLIAYLRSLADQPKPLP